MRYPSLPLSVLSVVVVATFAPLANAQSAPQAQDGDVKVLAPVVVKASADASAGGLSPAYAGGQVARGGRNGILGTQDNMDTPFSVTAYTNELIQDRQARSVGEVLQNDPGVRVARGFGNFQESYFMRGFILSSDDVAFNGLYSLLPRQYIATELFERVEVLRGASAFLNGAAPNGGGIGGAINLLPKRAPNEPLERLTLGYGTGGQTNVAADLAQRFGANDAFGVRVNVAQRDGDTAVDDESAKLSMASLGLDWRGDKARLSADLGWQENKLKRTRTNVTLSGVTSVPDAPDASANYAQPWSYSNERDVFGTLRGEYDLSQSITGWAAYGFRSSQESNSLANLSVSNASTGAGTVYRFDNTREDSVNTAELGLRGKLSTGFVGHEWVIAGSYFELDKKNAYAMDYANVLATNLYAPIAYSQPAFSAKTLYGNTLASPALNGNIRLSSVAVGDTLSVLDGRVLATVGGRLQRLHAQNYAYNSGKADTPYDDSRVSPVAGLVFKPLKQLSLYANYIEALVQGDTAPVTSGGYVVSNAGQMLAPYVSKQKEIGAKYDGGRLGLSVALFTTDKPRTMLSPSSATTASYSASGKDRHQGLEISAFGEAVKGLRVLGGVTLLNAKQRETGSAATDGKRVIGVPKQQATLGLELDVPGVKGLALDTRAVRTGSSYADAGNTLKVAGWTRYDMGARYLTSLDGHLLTLRARVDNVTNKSYWASVGGYPGSGYLTVGAPRTVSLSASVDY